MTEVLLQQLEEKMMVLLTEIDSLRREVTTLKHENQTLKSDQDKHSRKLQDLLSLLDAVNTVDTAIASAGYAVAKPVLVQG